MNGRMGGWACGRRGVRTLTFVFCICLLEMLASASNAAKSVQEPVSVEVKDGRVGVTFAPALQRALRRNFPGCVLPVNEDFSHGMDSDVPEYVRRPFAFFATNGDFDGDGMTDAAILLKTRTNTWVVAAFHQTSPGRFKPYIVEHWNQKDWNDEAVGDDGRLGFYIHRERPGLVRYMLDGDFNMAIRRLRNDGICHVWSEKASRVYYFRKSKYRYLQTSD